jgi:hypothetical protein
MAERGALVSAPLLAIAVAVVQLADIALHAATNQLEPLRIAANGVILLWLGLSVAVRLPGRRWTAGFALAVYLLLNIYFLAAAGLTNPAQGGALRTPLLVLVALTTVLCVWLAVRRAQAR